MVPRLIHQTAKTAEIPPQWAPLQSKLKNLHPGWEYRLWTDEDNESLIRDSFPGLLPVYLNLPKPIMRADMVRYAYMARFGGLYLDTDYECLKPFDLLDRSCVLPRESDDSKPIFLGNCVFASEAGHPFWTAVLDALAQQPPTKHSMNQEEDIIHLTGPGLLTRVYTEQFTSDPTIFVPPRGWFHPRTPSNDAEYKETARDASCYGIHFCFGSWRALSWKERLKNRWVRWWGR